jgi:hypothetical protein
VFGWIANELISPSAVQHTLMTIAHLVGPVFGLHGLPPD